MSSISCEGSALLPVILPPTNSTSAVGSKIVPVLNTIAVASTATLQTIVPFTLPKGRWLVTGVLRPDATVALQTLTGSVSIVVDVGVFWTYETVTPAEDGLMVVLSCVVDSDGNDVFSIPAVLTTSGGATYGITDNNTNRVQLTRLA